MTEAATEAEDAPRAVRFGELRALIRGKARESDIWHELDSQLGKAKNFLGMIAARESELHQLDAQIDAKRRHAHQVSQSAIQAERRLQDAETKASEVAANAEGNAADIVAKAESEAEGILDNARSEAARIVGEAEAEAAKVNEAIASLRGLARGV